jgi:hypothetical protein
MVYCAAAASLTVDMSKVAGPTVNAFWIDPRTADSVAIGQLPNDGVQSFSTPAGWEDALLVLEVAG